MGIDGITLSADGKTLYFGVVSGRYIYSVPTARLLDDTSSNAQMKSIAAVNRLVQKGVSDGYEVDSNDYIYVGSFETNSVNVFFPNNLTVSTLVRDPRIGWTDSFSVVNLESGGSLKGYLYFIENQLWKSDREKPYALFRVPLPDGGLKIT
jgi:sugar lactone lactonase YvrE